MATSAPRDPGPTTGATLDDERSEGRFQGSVFERLDTEAMHGSGTCGTQAACRGLNMDFQPLNIDHGLNMEVGLNRIEHGT